jgi:hypothetical protein
MKALGLKATKWKVFERLVARLYLTNMEDNIGDGVIITWNDKIPEVNTGRLRQVDVSIRFKRGFHTYLTVVECRDHDAPTPISHVEAFVEKTRKIQADKGVMISVKGFQGGAIEAARQGGIDLFVLSEQIHGWEPFQQVRETVNYKLGSAIIKSSNSEEFSLVGNDNLSRLRDLKYMEDGTDYIDLRGLLEKAIGDARAKRRMDSHRWSYNPTSAATLDTGNGQISEIREITFNFESIVQRSSANLHLPPRVVSCVLQSARNNDKVIVPQWKIRAPDIKPGLQANKFYSNLFFQKYRCNKVTPKIELTLLDDVQHGNKLQATLTLANDVQDHPDRERYFEITNPTMCSSLEESYSRYIGGRPRIKNPES